MLKKKKSKSHCDIRLVTLLKVNDGYGCGSKLVATIDLQQYGKSLNQNVSGHKTLTAQRTGTCEHRTSTLSVITATCHRTGAEFYLPRDDIRQPPVTVLTFYLTHHG